MAREEAEKVVEGEVAAKEAENNRKEETENKPWIYFHKNIV